jgi:CRP-like cAMP-binding protein
MALCHCLTCPECSGHRPVQCDRDLRRRGCQRVSYRKDKEIYGEGERSEYVYQVIRGAVRTYKLLDDGRRQIGAFHLPGDVFGLDAGSTHRLTAEAIADTTVPPGEAPQPGSRRGIECPGRP